MHKIASLLICLAMLADIHSQISLDPLSGTYSGFSNGDAISLNLQPPSGNAYTGIMKDSYQTYAVALTRNGSAVQGSATESSLGLVFQISGVLIANQLNLNFAIELQGMKTTMDISFTKEDGAGQAERSMMTNQLNLNFPAGAEHPTALVGRWTKEELYQSGSGDNYMGAGFSQSTTFLSNGQMAEAGSNAHISGSNYSGQSSGGNNDVVPGVLWYTQGNQLYLLVTENGVTQTLHLGKFYIEDQNMLITGTNGEKILMRKN